MASGSCACRYITYTTSNPPNYLVNCHCTTCRKQAGAPYQSWAVFPSDDIKWTTKPTEWRATETATRSFCPRCGSILTMKLDRDLTSIDVAAGTLDDGKTLIPLPGHHIFLQEKASWYKVPEDGAKRWDEWGDYHKW
ncbi:hypothetical protein PENANT_c004G07026 [Penicillium antarcticum]|uniref:CENP-V/GFA domain-containing protein n=1 Tax=Penicillium antarcticum TaxID=416450 RepID=A0A1V6QGJ1_9EURO|nr:uncharacterized protein N7508_002328 [Penicillium antarcticum]KAJ5317820.1 hypothetical protein N7508_002328 [Penicillium antarcticum]OQD88328.1 hypothetical protein PENANT_c004G07026 [Penicillium antarcticum]